MKDGDRWKLLDEIGLKRMKQFCVLGIDYGGLICWLIDSTCQG